MKNEKITTMEHLEMEIGCSGSVMKYGDLVFAAFQNWKGEFEAEIYKFVETPEETGLGFIECRISRIAKSTKPFADGGHAIEWCINNAK